MLILTPTLYTTTHTHYHYYYSPSLSMLILAPTLHTTSPPLSQYEHSHILSTLTHPLIGPPGTGKTLTARILASRCDRPLVHLKLEDIVSKWYGDSEKKLASIFDACDELEGTIIFIDEVDSVAGTYKLHMNI